MYMERAPIPIDPEHPLANSPWGYANVGWGGRKFPRFEDAVTFDDDELDYRDFPNMTITYELTDREWEPTARWIVTHDPFGVSEPDGARPMRAVHGDR